MNHRKRSALTLLTLLFVALPSARADWFDRGWVSSPRWEKDAVEGRMEVQAFQRLVRVGRADVPVAAVTYFRFPKPEGFRPEAVAETMRQAMGFDRWSVRQSRDSRVFEANWVATGKLVRFYVTESMRTVRYSVAVIRLLDSEAARSPASSRRGPIAFASFSSPTCWPARRLRAAIQILAPSVIRRR
jgi:hypothetical protein